MPIPSILIIIAAAWGLIPCPLYPPRPLEGMFCLFGITVSYLPLNKLSLRTLAAMAPSLVANSINA
jgi:hypothetical protein